MYTGLSAEVFDLSRSNCGLPGGTSELRKVQKYFNTLGLYTKMLFF